MTENNSKDIFHSPLKVLSTRVRRTYIGGSTIDDWHGEISKGDKNMPEEWLSSTTPAVNPGFPPISNEGLSAVDLHAGKHVLLRDLMDAEPEAMLGAEHIRHHGVQMGVLAKLIDSAERLSIQVHPDKAFAKRHFGSDFGKTECWHILKTRAINGEEPYLLMGFAHGVTREYWQALFQRQDIPAMIASLNRVIPKPGDTYLIPGGLPHAIGPGCFLVEIQEPTDLTLRSERTMQDGTPIPDKLIFQGLDEELLMDCFHYEPVNNTTVDARIASLYHGCTTNAVHEGMDARIASLYHEPLHFSGGSIYLPLANQENTPCFSMERVVCKEALMFNATAFSILAVLSGRGTISSDNGHSLPIQKGDQLFCPAAMNSFTVNGNAKEGFEFILCHPPGAKIYPPTSNNTFV